MKDLIVDTVQPLPASRPVDDRDVFEQCTWPTGLLLTCNRMAEVYVDNLRLCWSHLKEFEAMTQSLRRKVLETGGRCLVDVDDPDMTFGRMVDLL